MKLESILSTALLLAASGASAQSAFPPTLDDPYYGAALPRSGAYFDAEHPGTGMFVDMRKDGAIFVHLAVYDADGKPTWYAVQDRFDPTYAFQLFDGQPFHYTWNAVDSIGSVTGPIYRTEGGACIGCEYTAPIIEEATGLGPISIVWTNTGNATVTIDGHSSNWMRLPLDGVDTAHIAGRWRMQAAFGLDLGDEARCVEAGCDAWFDSVVEIAPIDPLVPDVDYNVAAGHGPRAPGNVTHWFSVECVDDCERLADAHASVPPALWTDQPDLGPPFGDIDIVLWVDATTGAAGIEQLISNDHHTHWITGRRYSFTLHPGDDHWMARRAFTTGAFSPTGAYSARPLDGSLIRMDRVD